MKSYLYTLGTLVIASSLSFAQDAPAGPPKGPGGADKAQRPKPAEIFKKLDTSADGSLSLDEFKAGPMGQKDPAKAEEIYKKIDANADGSVTLEEFKAHRPMHREGKGGKGGPGKGGKGGAPPAPAPAPAAE